MALSQEQSNRYRAQLALPGMTVERQKRLFDAHVVIIGLNAVGTNCAKALAQAGVGRITAIDNGLVQESDLSSHSIFAADDIKHPRVDALKRHLQKVNPEIVIRNSFYKFDTHNADKVLQEAHLVAEALDNWQDKLLLSDCCMHTRKPLIHSGLMSFSFHVFCMLPGRSACLRCVFARLGLEDFPPEGISNGVLGAVASLAGAFQAAEAIKLITQLGAVSGNHLLRFDVLRSEFDDMTELIGRSDCPDCGRWG